MATFIDISGQRFGMLVAQRRTDKGDWICKCDCGAESVAQSGNLRGGYTKSCGCGQRKALVDFNHNKPVSEVGNRFGRLVVLSEAEPSRTGKRKVLCLCDCGKQKNIFLGGLRSGVTQSCGCLRNERTSEAAILRIRHGHSSGKREDGGRFNSRTYKSWKAMNNRCHKPITANYHLYGGRGITVYPDWIGPGGFDKFLAYIGERPELTSLDRIDVNGNYEPGNVRWASASLQAKNRRKDAYESPEFRAKLSAARKANWEDPEYRAKVANGRIRAKLARQI